MSAGQGSFSRRHILQGAGALLAHTATLAQRAAAAENQVVLYGQGTLPFGIRSRHMDVNGVTLHILEAGFDTPRKPCVMLLHGFPELAYTWRNQLLPLARAGFHVVAPDLRGYGTGMGRARCQYYWPRYTDNYGKSKFLGARVVGHSPNSRQFQHLEDSTRD